MEVRKEAMEGQEETVLF